MADTVDNRPAPPGPGERRPGPAGATDLASRNDRDMPSGPASPGRRWRSPPAAGARPGQRGRPGWSARAGALLRNFVAAVPRDLAEAASIDGAGPARVLWRILFPLVAPGLVATS